MSARLERRGGGEFAVRGELDFDSVAALWQESEKLFREELPQCIDLAEVSRSNSAGVALLVDWLRQARRRDRKLRFVNVPSQMVSIIEVADLDTVLPFDRLSTGESKSL